MRIGIDARELCGRPTGVGRHLAGLLSAWARSEDTRAHSWFLYAPERIAVDLPAGTTVRIVPGEGGTKWEQMSLPHAAASDALDVFFAPGYSAPLRMKCPVVLVIHDLSFVTHPEWFRTREGLRRRLLTRWSARLAARVLTVSEMARQEIITHLGVPAGDVRCIYPGVTSLDSPASIALREPLVLFAGSIFNRRHVPDLIRGFKLVARDHPEARLEIVGDNRTYPHQDLAGLAASEGIPQQVSIRPYVADAELARLYHCAGAFAFLSEYEGFGHPPLEALNAGVPSVLLDTVVSREICGNAAVYVAPGDVRALASALTRLLFDATARARVMASAPQVLARYSWPRAARETLEALECAI